MYAIVNRAGLVVALTSAVSYVKVTDTGLPIITTPEEATAVYAADTDTFHPLRFSAAVQDGPVEVREVGEVPPEVVPGFWYWSEADGFYTTPEREAAQAEEEARKAAPVAASIAFVTLAEAGAIDDTTATENASQFEFWAIPVQYKAGAIRRYDGALYRCLMDHTSQEDWSPDAAPSLWVKVGDPAEEWPEWSLPIGSVDAYPEGARVSHDGKHWTSAIPSNVWEPGVYGWEEVNENV